MLSLGSQYRFYLYTKRTDMRKSFDALSGLVRNELKRNPLDGDVYVFLNRQRNLVKLLQWDRTGFAIYAKRLEQGTFELPKSAESYPHQSKEADAQTELKWAELMLILEGISLKSVRYRKRYEIKNEIAKKAV
jgi:transposase